MINSEIILKYLSQNKKRFHSEYQLVKIGIFGSIARNENSSKSDIDILVEFEENTQELYEKKQNLKKEIQSTFNLHVDICREKYIKPAFRDQILSEALYA
jgi:predicted nucleotidyltransferase